MGWDDVGRIRQAKVNRSSLLSNEQGTIIKDWGGRLPIALVYPNSYYIGMSNLGIHAIYKYLNSYNDVVCERTFQDFKFILSFESKKPLIDFAVVAFSISYELDYFNVVDILKKSNIPLYSSERDDHHPLVVAGGACITANPMPLAPFFDCLCIGEAELILPELLAVLSHGIDRREIMLRELAKLPGIYVPYYHKDTIITRQWAPNLDDFVVSSSVITTETELGNLYLIEVGRGCNWSCRFCLVSGAFCPTRYRSIDSLIRQASKGLKYRKRLGLVGPIVSDHPQIEELLTRLRYLGAGISLSSLRVNPLSTSLLDEIVKGGIRTVTLAPEAGSQRLRQVIGKKILQDDILTAVARIADRGIKRLKLYFMIGLPTETDEDIEEIISLCIICKEIIEKGEAGGRLSLNVAPFVPKAGTPFQWLPMAGISTLKYRLEMLKRELSPKGIKLKSESLAWSHVQASLARGDIKMAEVLAGMGEISLAGWRKAVDEYRFDLAHYVLEKWDTDHDLPWENIKLGSSKEYLISELNRAVAV
ncbi:MAG: radical SAM protein [Dehalococcoidia bacterium]|nr:MAG: radical SAM protein [Dehalococcoidia bacterium]